MFADLGQALSDGTERLSPDEIVHEVLGGPPRKPCITCSFQAEDMVVLDYVRKVVPEIPVLFLETGYHFAETYAYRDRMVKEWNLNLVELKADMTVKEQESKFGILNQTDPTHCCQIRKVEPLMRGLGAYDVWFTGLRREQSQTRATLRKLEDHRLPGGRVVQKVSILADWTWKDVWSYTVINEIPYLPLYDRGYQSIGCEPCTAFPTDPTNPRSGRWGGHKLECGIHTFSDRQ